jgi:hypothetical protein
LWNAHQLQLALSLLPAQNSSSREKQSTCLQELQNTPEQLREPEIPELSISDRHYIVLFYRGHILRTPIAAGLWLSFRALLLLPYLPPPQQLQNIHVPEQPGKELQDARREIHGYHFHKHQFAEF